MLHLVIGPVGAGKSTFARRLADDERAVHLDLDAWMAALFAADRPQTDTMPWYLERTERCIAQIWSTTRQLVAVGTNVVLEIGMIRRADRHRLYGWIDADALDVKVWVVDAPREVRRARVEQRNRERGATFKMVVPPEIFELASDLWEPPDDDERDTRAVVFVGDP